MQKQNADSVSLVGLPVATPSRRRRQWSAEQKLSIVLEAESAGNSVSAVARQYAISTNLLFIWRKELRARAAKTRDQVDPSDEFDAMIARLKMIDHDIERLIANRFVADLKAGRMSAYVATCGYVNLVSAYCKLEKLRLEIFDRLVALPPEKVKTWSDNFKPEEQREIRRVAETILTTMGRNSVMAVNTPAGDLEEP